MIPGLQQLLNKTGLLHVRLAESPVSKVRNGFCFAEIEYLG